MRADIERYLGGRPVQAPAVAAGAAAGAAALAGATAVVPAAEATSVVPMAEDLEDEDDGGGSRRWWLVAILVLLGILAALAAWALPQLLADPPAERVAVPDVVDLKQADAVQAIEDVGLVASVETQPDDEVRKGLVISQNPDADTRVDLGSTVDLVVSEGKPQVTVKSVIGERKNAAKQILEDQGLEVVLEVRDSDETPNTVVETDPPAGTSVAVGSTVTVYYSAGPVAVENVVGKQEDAARQILENQGFDVKVFYDDNPTDQPTGTVLEQTPEAGTKQPQGTQIVLLVTEYVEPTEPPSPTDSPTEPPPTTDPTASPTTQPRPAP
jgi:serine/threonine-protein kinase